MEKRVRRAELFQWVADGRRLKEESKCDGYWQISAVAGEEGK
jgi:hypothetical protein